MGFVCGWRIILTVTVMVWMACPSSCGLAWDCDSHSCSWGQPLAAALSVPVSGYASSPGITPCLPPMTVRPCKDLRLKLAYGRTFGTCTMLDYATVELSKSVTRYPAQTICGPAVGEVQVALLGSYVFYYEGDVERLHQLDFHDGYELAWIPKGRFTFPVSQIGMAPYLESGAGLSYVSETFRNSGSRWNWSLLGGFGMESCLADGTIFSMGVQWRHLSNGNMWGKGDELHNSNSGTDMIQALLTMLHRF